jgi:glutathione S-transferase
VTDRPLLVIGNRNYSSWSLRPWILAQHLELALDVHRIELDTPNFRSEALRYSPTGRVPVLIHGDLVIPESIAIMEYLSELADARGWPASREQRAEARSVAAEMHGGFATLRASYPMNIRASQRRIAMTPALAKDIARVSEILERANVGHDEAPWLFGRYCAADAMFLPVAFRFKTFGTNGLSAQAAAYVDQATADPRAAEWVAMAHAEVETLEQEEVGR